MSLPYLKRKQMVGLISQKFASNGIKQPEETPTEEAPQDQGLDFCAHDLITAVHAKDVKGVTAALRAAFELMEKEPHEENNEEPNSFDDMNKQAGEI